MNSQLVFALNDTELIVINLPVPLEAIHPCSEVETSFMYGTEKYLLNVDCVVEVIEALYYHISRALDDTAYLHESITKDIGYLWNEHFQRKSGLVYKKQGNRTCWVGFNNLLWSAPGNARPCLDTWIYNKFQGQIILELTPNYDWHFDDPKPGEEFIPYGEWIQNYKPLLIRTISREQALMWQQQAKNALEILEKNRLRYEELDEKSESQEQ